MRYQYTIAGEVIEGPGIDDSAGYLASLGISIGSPVSFTFIIDLSAPGYIKMSDGTLKYPPDVGDFFVKYISGTTLTIDTYINSYNGVAEQNYGHPQWFELFPPYAERHLSPGNGNNYLNIYDMKKQPDERDCWPVGSDFGSPFMQNIIYDASGNKSSFYFYAKIVNLGFAP